MSVSTWVLAQRKVIEVQEPARVLPLSPAWTLGQVADELLATRLDPVVVFVAGLEGYDAEHDQTPVEIAGGDPREPDDAWRVRVRRGAGVVLFVFVHKDAGRIAGHWSNLSAAELYAALRAFERIVGVSWRDSIGRTAEALILSTHPRARGGVLLDPAPASWMPEPALDGGLELAYQAWRRPLVDDEPSRRWVHVYDANAQYLAAWIAAEVGIGRPAHHDSITFDAKRAGLWRLDAAALTAGDVDELLPPIATPGREWVTTPTAQRIAEVCDAVPIVREAWLWPRRSRFFRATGERLRDARAQAMAAIEDARNAGFPEDGRADERARAYVGRIVTAGAVLDAIKDLYRVETGRLQMARSPESPWARPDWAHTIRATARTNLHRRLAKLARRPFAIATDGLMFATDEPDPLTFAAAIGLPIGNGLGQFTHEYTSAAAPVLAAYDEHPRGVTPLLRAVYDNREAVRV